MAENDLEVKVLIEDTALANKMLDDALTEIERLTLENTELKAALSDLVKAYLTLSQACGAGIDALNKHSKVVMGLEVTIKAGK